MRCVGYRQAWEHLEGVYDRAALRDRGICARRQLAWLRAMNEPKVFDCLAPDLGMQVIAHLARQISEAGGGAGNRTP